MIGSGAEFQLVANDPGVRGHRGLAQLLKKRVIGDDIDFFLLVEFPGPGGDAPQRARMTVGARGLGASTLLFQSPIHVGDVTGDGKPELIVAPLHGRGTKAADWTDGPGSRILVFTVPDKPADQRWPVEVACDSLHIVHNFTAVGKEIWAASAEGVYALSRSADGKWSKRLIAEGKPDAVMNDAEVQRVYMGIEV